MAGTEAEDVAAAAEAETDQAALLAAAAESPTADEVEGDTRPLLELLEHGIIEPPEVPFS